MTEYNEDIERTNVCSNTPLQSWLPLSVDSLRFENLGRI